MTLHTMRTYTPQPERSAQGATLVGSAKGNVGSRVQEWRTSIVDRLAVVDQAFKPDVVLKCCGSGSDEK